MSVGHSLTIAGLIIAILGLTTQASAQGLKLDSVGLFPDDGAQGQVLGDGSVPANPKDWPSTFIFKNSEGGGCTATAVGQKVILTAAHCVKNGATGEVRTTTTTAQVSCLHHPNYPSSI